MSSLYKTVQSNKPFLDQIVTCDKKVDFIWQPAQWLDWEAAPKHFPKPSLHQKKVMVTVWWSTASLIHYSYLNLWETITSEKYVQQINETHREMQCLSWQWSTERAQFFSTTLPDHMSHNQHFKGEWIALQSFVSFTKFTCPLANQLLLFQASRKLFAGKMLPQPAGGRKCFPRVHRILTYRFLHYRNKQIYFSLAKMCWL